MVDKMLNGTSKLKKEVEKLVETGKILDAVLFFEIYPDKLKENIEDGFSAQLAKTGSFTSNYQEWYSTALFLVKKILPDRLKDFESYYEPEKNRKKVTPADYKIKDYVTGVEFTTTQGQKVTSTFRDCSRGFKQQIAIVKAARNALDSSIHQMKQLLHAEVFDDELHVAEELLSKGHVRAAGVVAGVVLEGHLKSVCVTNSIRIPSKAVSLSKLREILLKDNIVDVPTSRKIDFVADIRNRSAHKGDVEPTKSDVEDMIAEVTKLIRRIS